ncbi:MAG: hypothetical protein JWP25_7712 [Bradyrhizobium sp.]|nr:hypothetical protein [Bradyrhizobium sp.]
MRGAISGLSASRKLRILSNVAGLKKNQMLQQNVGNCKNFTEPLVSNDDVCMGNIVRRVIDHVTIEISNRSNGVHLYMHQSAIFYSTGNFLVVRREPSSLRFNFLRGVIRDAFYQRSKPTGNLEFPRLIRVIGRRDPFFEFGVMN